jgi:hypothetical protein
VCDTDDCFAVYVAVETGNDEDARSASEVSQLARDAAQGEGWVVSFRFRQPVMTCPGCADGRGPGPRAWGLPTVHGPRRCGVQVRVLPAPGGALAARGGLNAPSGRGARPSRGAARAP